jgi:ABC-type multidrug transport system fused ATPase/permease subunit
MTPRDWYTARQQAWAQERDRLDRRATGVSRLRLLTFFGAVAAFGWGSHASSILGAIAGLLLLVVFAALVARHARLLYAIECAEAKQSLASRGIARLDRRWDALPEVLPQRTSNLDAHSYARDIDLFGRVSLTKWLGPAATTGGDALLQAALLEPASAGDIAKRQEAIAELADRPESRERLAAEGQIARIDPGDLERFLAWAEGSARVLPAPMRIAVLGLTAAIWLGLLLQIFQVTDESWWLAPLVAGVVLSFAYARRVYDVFDRASMGRRMLQRYSSMLRLVCDEEWRAPELTAARDRLREAADAPTLVARLSRLVEWSELRSGAALLHFPIQAFSLWDFHVFFLVERWRRLHGRRIRGWLTALAHVDALSVLAAVKFDNPEWSAASVDGAQRVFTASALGHPLIADARRVPNDIEIGPAGTLVLVTGSNMSGKSTLLRAVGLNIVLAQAGAPVCARSLSMPRIDLQTSIRVQDSLELGLSDFMAALARLKAIVDAANDVRPGRVLLYLLDEVLQGTNSAERAIAVQAIAQHLLDAGAIGAMTTHDLSLADAEPLASHARPVHFAEQVHADGTMTFDYRLEPGIATSRNALRLMQLIGLASS